MYVRMEKFHSDSQIFIQPNSPLNLKISSLAQKQYCRPTHPKKIINNPQNSIIKHT